MKVYVSADIEGIAGMVSWDEADPVKAGWREFRERMTAHVAAACEGALAAGAEDVLVKDAHYTGRNILAERLPRGVRLSRGWSGHPLLMVEGLDASYDAVMMIGYHCRAGSGGSPQAHTMSSSRIALMEIDGRPVSEFHLFAWAAADLDVPVVLVSGDEELCAEVRALSPAIRTVAAHRGVGAATVSRHPAEVEEELRRVAGEALRADRAAMRLEVPEPAMRITFRDPAQAYQAGFYPGCVRESEQVVAFSGETWLDLLTALSFLLSV